MCGDMKRPSPSACLWRKAGFIKSRFPLELELASEHRNPLPDRSVKKSWPRPFSAPARSLWSRLRIGDSRNRPLAEPRRQGAGCRSRMPVGNSKGKADFFTDPDSDSDDRGSESAIYAICRSLSRARQRVIPSPRAYAWGLCASKPRMSVRGIRILLGSLRTHRCARIVCRCGCGFHSRR